MLKNLQRGVVLCLYMEHFLRGGGRCKIFLDEMSNLFQGDALPNNGSNFCRQMMNCMKAWDYLQKTLNLPLNTKIIKQTHKFMMEDEKDVLSG